PRPAPAGTGAHRASRAGGVLFDPFSAVAAWLLRRQTIGLALVTAGTALLVVTLSGRPFLHPLGAPFARLLGAGVLLVAPALAALGLAVHLRRPQPSRLLAGRGAGWLMAALVLWGLL
ncbi:MAG: hypothetical protein C4290_07675, partial [Chloroflexota bacterium]